MQRNSKIKGRDSIVNNLIHLFKEKSLSCSKKSKQSWNWWRSKSLLQRRAGIPFPRYYSCRYSWWKYISIRRKS